MLGQLLVKIKSHLQFLVVSGGLPIDTCWIRASDLLFRRRNNSPVNQLVNDNGSELGLKGEISCNLPKLASFNKKIIIHLKTKPEFRGNT